MCDPRLALSYADKMFAEKFKDSFGKAKKKKRIELAAKKPLARRLDYKSQNRKATKIAPIGALSPKDPQVVTRLIGA